MSTSILKDEKLGLHIGTVDWIGPFESATCVAFGKLFAGEGLVRISELKDIFLLFSHGRNFKPGAYVPTWDSDVALLAYPPAIGVTLVFEFHRIEYSVGKVITIASPWGYYTQFKEIVHQMGKMPLYRLHLLTDKGWKKTCWEGRDLSEMRKTLSGLPFPYLGCPAQLEVLENRHWIQLNHRSILSILMYITLTERRHRCLSKAANLIRQ